MSIRKHGSVRRPKLPERLSHGVADLNDLTRRDVAIKEMKDRSDGTIEINLRLETEFPSHGYDKIALPTEVAKAVEGTPALEEDATDHDRQ